MLTLEGAEYDVPNIVSLEEEQSFCAVNDMTLEVQDAKVLREFSNSQCLKSDLDRLGLVSFDPDGRPGLRRNGSSSSFHRCFVAASHDLPFHMSRTVFALMWYFIATPMLFAVMLRLLWIHLLLKISTACSDVKTILAIGDFLTCLRAVLRCNSSDAALFVLTSQVDVMP